MKGKYDLMSHIFCLLGGGSTETTYNLLCDSRQGVVIRATGIQYLAEFDVYQNEIR